MFVELGLLSLCTTSIGLYCCIANKYITPEDVDTCLINVDRSITKIENNLGDMMTNVEIKMNVFINNMIKEFKKQDEEEELQEEDALTEEIDLELGLNAKKLETILEMPKEECINSDEEERLLKTPKSIASSSNGTMDEFILLEHEN